MKLGFCMLLWATSVDDAHLRLLDDLKATGYDGVEIPVFDGTPDDYAALGKRLDDIGLEALAITVIPANDKRDKRSTGCPITSAMRWICRLRPS